MAATDPAADLAVTPRQVVEHEARRRPRTGLIALAAAVLTVVANVVQISVFTRLPRVNPIDALREAAGEPLGRTGLASAQALYLHDHAAGLVISTVLSAIVFAGLGYVLLELLRMTLDRAGRVARPTRVLVLVGAVLAAGGTVVKIIGLVHNASRFASSSDQGTLAAHDVARNGSVLVGGTLAGELGFLALAAATVMVALGAMRVGLLPRFVGVLGVIVGALQILPLSQAAFVITALWLLMVGMLMLGRWPRGMPETWVSGEAVAPPTQQELREQREAARGARRGGGGGGGVPRPAPAAEPTSATPSPATSARKKRKRRA